MTKFKKIFLLITLIVVLLFSWPLFQQSNAEAIAKKTEDLAMKEVDTMETGTEKTKKEIYLAGGCFWGLEEYFSKVRGVEEVTVGYANGNVDVTSYELLRKTEHAETIHVVYDENTVDLRSILLYYFRVVDPVSLNKQGNDTGKQYRTGIYYVHNDDLPIIEQAMQDEKIKLGKVLAVEVAPIKNYVEAEEYHQDYLKKNPDGYCHIDVDKANIPLIDIGKYPKPTDEELHKKLTSQQYNVTQKGVTEGAFSNQYWDVFAVGIYVDIVTGEPLFSSLDKFESDCGWPSFSKPISSEVVKFKEDTSFQMKRVEVLSRSGNSHLGHVFEDGPIESGGLRFCINSASILFIKKTDMKAQGYGYLESLV